MQLVGFSQRIAQTIEALRELKGVKQYTLSSALTIDQSSYSRRAIGNIPFSTNEIEIIAKILNVSVLQIIAIAMSDYLINENLEPLSEILKTFVERIELRHSKDKLTRKELVSVLQMLKEQLC